MIQPIVLFFLACSIVFALVHAFAIEASLYWHLWWFDVVMHFGGGVLIALGVVSLTTFRRVTLRPTYVLVLSTAIVMVFVWELFEWQVGLFDPSIHGADAIYDIVLGICGALAGFWILKKYTKIR